MKVLRAIERVGECSDDGSCCCAEVDALDAKGMAELEEINALVVLFSSWHSYLARRGYLVPLWSELPDDIVKGFLRED